MGQSVERPSERPVARVALDVPLAHLDRPFDYLVPEEFASAAGPGCRVRARFAGRDVGGFVLDRLAASEHDGRLAPLTRVVSPEPVLSPEVARLARVVADRYGGTLADVLRLAVPPRHAREEARPGELGPARPPPEVRDQARWAAYEQGPELLDAVARGGSPRAVWAALPGDARTPAGVTRWPGWTRDIAALVAATEASGRGALVVVPDHRDVELVAAAVEDVLGAGSAVRLTADLGPGRRYRRFLAVRRGLARVVVGTRAAAFAPVNDLGLVLLWDDGDDLHKEPRAPYPHVRDVLLARSHLERAAVVIGGLGMTVEAFELAQSGWARAVTPHRTAVRDAAPRVQAPAGDASEPDPRWRGRIPPAAYDVIRGALERGPVLVQVPRAGYVPALACDRCRAPARCVHCSGPLGLAAGTGPPRCRWCGRVEAGWRCPECTGTQLRAPVLGSVRTTEELGRAFPNLQVLTSSGDRVLATVPDRPALVVATTGAEPVAVAGYAAAVLLDGWILLGRADLRAGEEALRRWMAAAGLVRRGSDGGEVVLVAPANARASQALIRWDSWGLAERERADRADAGLPPAARLASVRGAQHAVVDLLGLAELPAGADVLGPVPDTRHDAGERDVRALVRVPAPLGGALAGALHAAQAVRSARKSDGSVRVELDPLDL